MRILNQFTFAVALFSFLFQKISAQSDSRSFNKGTVAINAGIGIIGSIHYYGSGVKRSPVYSFTGEYGILKLGPGILGGGIAFGFQSASYTANYGSYYYKDKWSTVMFGLRGTYHPDILNGEKYDLYGIVQLSFNHFGYSFTTNDPYYNSYLYGASSLSSYIRPYLMVGARYYFTKNFGVYSELGYDIALLKLGITLKFDKK